MTIAELRDKKFQLGASAAVNDLWLHIDFNDVVFEEQLQTTFFGC